MSLLDGTYEVLRQRPLSETQTLFEASDPGGAPLRIVWFELEPEQEAAFERYRRTLKRLQRAGVATVRDATSRPGAHYVVWERVPDDAPRVRDRAVERALVEAGAAVADAEVRRVDGAARVVALAFDGTAPPQPAPATSRSSERAAEAESARRAAPAAALGRALARRWNWLASAALLLAAALVFVSALERTLEDRVVAVPDLVGSDVNAAAEQLRALGLTVRPTPRPSASAAGAVLKLDPPPGSEIRPRRAIELVYALPPGSFTPVAVPDLTGLPSVAAAERALGAARLELGRVARVSAPDAAGVVLAQRPAAERDAPEGSAVDLLVSSGPRGRQSFVPDLIGLELDDARALAAVAGLDDARVIVERVPGAPGVVVSQSLAPYVPFPLASGVLRLLVGSGAGASDEGAVPDVTGLDRDAARALLADAGLMATVREIGTTGLPAGVVAQDPPPGREADGAVTLTVNAPPVPIPRPEASVTVRQPQLRVVPYRWPVEGGIPEVTATVYAETLEGERVLVDRTRVRGGGEVAGGWLTRYPGVVTFRLELNGAPYGPPLRVP